jgi:hypothetical protein
MATPVIQRLDDLRRRRQPPTGKVILEFADFTGPDVAYLENLTSDLYVECEADVYRHTLACDHLRAQALGPPESTAMIKRIAAE